MCGVSTFSDDKEFCNIGVCVSITVFEGVLSKYLDSSSKEGSKISLSEVLGWFSDIFIKEVAEVIGASFSFSL